MPVKAVWLAVSHTHSAFMPDEIEMASLRDVVVRTAAAARDAQAARADRVGLAWADTADTFVLNRRADAPNGLGRFSVYQCIDCTDDGNFVDGSGWMRTRLKQDGATAEELAELHGPAPLARPCDGRLQLLLLADGNKPVAGIVRFSAHAVVLSSGYYKPHFSRDYCGALVDRLQEQWGCPMLFLQGFCGDQRPRHRECTPAERDRIGVGLANLMAPNSTPVRWADLDRVEIRRRIVRCETLPGLAGDMANLAARITEAQAQLAAVAHGVEHLAERKRRAERLRQLRSTLRGFVGELEYLTADEVAAGAADLEVAALDIGPWTLIAMPGEMCSGVSLTLQAELGDNVVLGNYVNGTACYFLDEDDMSFGGYEACTSLFAPRCVEDLIQAGRDVARRQRAPGVR